MERDIRCVKKIESESIENLSKREMELSVVSLTEKILAHKDAIIFLSVLIEKFDSAQQLSDLYRKHDLRKRSLLLRAIQKLNPEVVEMLVNQGIIATESELNFAGTLAQPLPMLRADAKSDNLCYIKCCRAKKIFDFLQTHIIG